MPATQFDLVVIGGGPAGAAGANTAALFNRACFNYPALGDLCKYATYDALLRRADIKPSKG